MNKKDVIESLVCEQRRPDHGWTNRGFINHAQA
jgi:hypothetical protein